VVLEDLNIKRELFKKLIPSERRTGKFQYLWNSINKCVKVFQEI
jgi:hypothetical protein